MTPPQTRGARSVRPGAMARRELRLQAELLDRVVVPGIDFYVRLAVDAVGGDGGDDEAESVSVSAITCEWHGTERLDPAWVRPARGASSAPASSGGGGLAPGERFFARSPAAKVAADVVARAGETLAFRVGLCLPPGMPPSFRGAVARYAYAVTFVATTGGDRVVHRMPLPVETVSGVADGGAAGGGRGWGLAGGGIPQASGGFLGAALSPSSSRHVLRNSPDAGSPTGRPAVGADVSSSPTHRLARSDSLPPPESPGSPLAALSLGFAGGGVDSPASCGSSPFGRAAPATAPAAAYAIALDDGSRLLRVIPRAPTPRCVAGGAFEVALDFGTEDEPSAGAAGRGGGGGGDSGGGDSGGGGGGGGGGDGRFRCERVSVSLETEEVVVHSAVDDLRPGSPPVKSLEDRERDGECVVTRKVWCERSEWTSNTRETHFCLASPTDAPASFRTSRAQLRWIARFEFTASAELGGGGRRVERKVEWRMPVEMSGAHALGLGARVGTARGVPAGWDGARGSMTRESSLLAL